MTGTAAKFGSEEDPRLETARKRLRESVGQADTLEAIREIVTGLVGCEEMGIFIVDQGNSELFWSFGIDAEQHRTLDKFEASALQCVLRGECYIAPSGYGAGYSSSSLQVFVPILCNGRTAVLVMLRLLPQKTSFDDSDIRLVNLLSHEAGKGLFDTVPNAEARAARRKG